MSKRKYLIAVLLTIATASPGAELLLSPEVHADRSITFRLKAPDAKLVEVRCEGQTTPMQKDEQGVWSVTTAPFEPDIYSYSFLVDGLRIYDPANPFLKYSLFGYREPGSCTRPVHAPLGNQRRTARRDSPPSLQVEEHR